MRVLGIDPGLNNTGYGIIDFKGDQLTVIEAGVLRSHEKDDLSVRLRDIADELGNVIMQLEPDVMAIEELYSHYGHPKTAIVMGHARGVIFLKAAEAGLKVHSYSSTRVKKSLTGNGRSSKAQVQQMIATSLGLSKPPEPPDVADALAVALCHGRTLFNTTVAI